ncbi:hypothetical protein LR48_Vigan06g089600 [Vigna angularis]|uniref:Uncharacterized protein n=1 Tax=Phaseolus angularis TaxID=3914 RepID=A0A0L9URU4_PHAAN|nr:hypothetical protein LR48_Vigan06g089600 [Vigna angularis]
MNEMQQRHEDKLVVVKAECEARIAREVAGREGEEERAKEKGKAAAEDQAEHNSERDKTWKPTESEAEGSKAKSIHAESATEDRRMVVKPEPSSTLLLPFVQAIMDVQISEQFVPPQFKTYDGTTDPEAHIKTFSNASGVSPMESPSVTTGITTGRRSKKENGFFLAEESSLAITCGITVTRVPSTAVVSFIATPVMGAETETGP